MGIRGYYSYKYKGKYYKFYNHSDSYPSGLGVNLVRSIPTDPGVFEEWLSTKRRQFEDGVMDDEKGEVQVEGLEDYPPEHCIFIGIRWTYVIDLDRLQFVVDNNVFFRLDKLPRGRNDTDWTKYFRLDGCGDRCIPPSTPREILADIHPDIEDLVLAHARESYSSVTPQILDSATWTRTASSRPLQNQLSLYAFKSLVENHYGLFSTLHQHRPDSSSFQMPAQFLLTTAAPGILHFTEDRAQDRLKENPITYTVTREPHSKDVPRRWWFRNCLVFMASRLDDETCRKGWIGLVLEEVRKCPSDRSTYTALLWSVRHAVVVIVSDAGVSHSPAIPVIDAFGVDDEAFTNGVDFLMHFLQPSSISLAMDSVRSSIVSSTTTELTDRRSHVPFDVVMRIFDFVDVKTYNSCAVLARSYRINWAKHPRIGPFKLFKAKTTPDESHSECHNAVGALRCGDFIASSPQNVHLFNPSNGGLRGSSGTSINLQIHNYDPVVSHDCLNRGKLEDILAELSRGHYIIPCDGTAQCRGKDAFEF